MRAQWHALHANLVRSSNRLQFQTEFRAMVQRHAVLRGIADPAALLARLHAPGGDPVSRNTILHALAAEAREGSSDTALILVILALWPGLDAAYGRLWRHFRSEPERLVSEISARIITGIRRMDPTRVTWVAATLIRNVERDIRRMLTAEWAAGALTEELSEADEGAEISDTTRFTSSLPFDTDRAAGVLSEELRVLIGEDAALVMLIAVQGEMQRAAAMALGLTYDGARKRYQRALARLRPHFDG